MLPFHLATIGNWPKKRQCILFFFWRLWLFHLGSHFAFLEGPRNLPCFHNPQFRTHVQSIQQPVHDNLCLFHMGLLGFPFSLPSMRTLYIFSRHLSTRWTTILRRNCGAKYFLCIIFSFGVFYAYPFVLCGIFVRYLFCIIISFFDFDLIIYDFSSLFRVCSECARNVLRVDILHFQLCFFRNIKMF